jgi:hypothetical protein
MITIQQEPATPLPQRPTAAAAKIFPLSVHSSPLRVSPSVKLPFLASARTTGGGDRHFLAPPVRYGCAQGNSAYHLLDNAAQTPRYLAKVVACMAGDYSGAGIMATMPTPRLCRVNDPTGF